MTIVIKKRTYHVEETEVGERTRADLVQRGWDGKAYILKGERSAVRMAYRNATTGEFSIVY